MPAIASLADLKEAQKEGLSLHLMPYASFGMTPAISMSRRCELTYTYKIHIIG
jgi:hypothetical protein